MGSTKKLGARPRLINGVLAGLTALALSACNGTDVGDGPAAASTPQRGGELTIVAASPQLTWDPAKNSGWTLATTFYDRMTAVYGQLLYYDAAGEQHGVLAESLTSDDGVKWTLKVRQGVTFTDGTPFDASAIKFNWDRQKAASVNMAIASTITSTVVDDHTLDITLSSPNRVFAAEVSESINYIASPAAVEAQGQEYVDPVGAGPFILESTDQTAGETFVRNPDYWEEGKPYLDKLNVIIALDPTQRYNNIVVGDGDIAFGFDYQWLGLEDSPNVKVVHSEVAGMRLIWYNNKRPEMGDPRARKAVNLALDTDEHYQVQTQDPKAKGWNNMFPEDSPFYDAEFTLETNNPEAAQKLFDELKADGVDMSDLEIVTASLPETIRQAEHVQQTLEAFNGVGAHVVVAEGLDYLKVVRDEGKFDIAIGGGDQNLANPAVWMLDVLGAGSQGNWARYESPEMAEALKELRTAYGTDDFENVVADVQRVWAKDMPFLVDTVDRRAFFLRDRVGEFPVMVGRGAYLVQDLHVTK